MAMIGFKQFNNTIKNLKMGEKPVEPKVGMVVSYQNGNFRTYFKIKEIVGNRVKRVKGLDHNGVIQTFDLATLRYDKSGAEKHANI